MNNEIQPFDPKNTIPKQVIKLIKELHKKVSKIKTPVRFTKKKQGYTYVERHYMKMMADKFYPGWCWIIVKTDILGDTAYVVHGRLIWQEEGVRRIGDMVAAHRIMKSTKTDTYIDIGNDIKSANQDCFKKALNQYLNICDDVYKMSEEEIEKEKVDELLDLAKNIGDEHLKKLKTSINNIKTLIEDGAINARNINKKIKALNNILEEKEKENDE